MNQNQQYIIERITKIGDCWLWNNAKKDGYGQVPQRTRVARQYRKYYAHQISFIVFKGAIPIDVVVRHKCRNRHCCNPDHLELGTVYDNNQDKIRDGTQPHILTEQQVLEIRALHNQGRTIVSLADQYDMSHSAISYVVNRKTWKHI